MASGTFASQCKRANIIPVHKKNDKQIVSNYRAVSLLPICSKVFERRIFNELFKFFEDKNLLFKHQSCFHLGGVIHVFTTYLQSLMTHSLMTVSTAIQL